MFKRTLIVFLIVVSLGISDMREQDKNNIVINIGSVVNDSLNMTYSDDYQNLRSLNEYPSFNKDIKNRYKGIPTNDSVLFFGKIEEKNQFIYDYYKQKKYSPDIFNKEIKKWNIDTLMLSKTPLKQGLIAIIGFLKDKQFIVGDINRNLDFSDDLKYEYDINFRNSDADNNDVLNNLPISNYDFEKYSNGKISIVKRKIVLYPTKKSAPVVSKQEFEYTSRYRYKDYWMGQKIINDKIYEFYYDGRVIIKPKSAFFSKNDIVYNQQFLHFKKDTVILNNNLYIIDSVSKNITNLYLREILKSKKVFENRTEGYLRNYCINDLNNKKVNLNSIIKNKKYTLIDFWGTWCGPCIEMTPKLKNLYTTHSSNLNIVGIARDKNVRNVQNYIKKEKLNWINLFQNYNQESKIIKELDIKYYPTFILLNSEGKILYRGSSESFEEIIKIIL